MTEREKFLAERKTGIGGSDAASLFSIGYGCERRLFYDKTGVAEDHPREETKAMSLGKLMEPWFAAEYAKETGNEVVQDAVFVRSPSQPELCVHIDAWVRKVQAPPKGVAEIKSVGRGAWYKYKREGLPDDYVLQLQHGMGVTGCTWGVFIVGCRDSGEILHWEVAFRPDVFEEIRSAAAHFWDMYVKRGYPVDRLEPDDHRCASCSYRTTCQGEHISLAAAGLTAKDGYEMDNSILPLLIERAERSELRKQANDLFEETNETLKSVLGDRKLVCTEEGHKVQFYGFVKKAYTVPEHEEKPLRVYAPKGEKAK
jgi:hypothetical protein